MGPNHTSTLNSINGLATLYMKEQQYAKAEPLYDECILKRKTELGEKHPGTYSAMHNRALLHIQQNQLDEAETLLTECVRGRRELCGRSHADTLESVQLLAFVFERCRPIKATRAERMYLDCLTRRKESLGVSHPQTLSTMHNLVRLPLTILILLSSLYSFPPPNLAPLLSLLLSYLLFLGYSPFP